MNSDVSLEYQTFWTHPRKSLNAHNKPSECRSSTPRAVRRSAHEQICTVDRELPSGCNDVDTDRNHNDVQSGRLVRFPDGLLGQEFAAEDLMRIARQQAATIGPAVEATQSAYARASPPASDTVCFSKSPSASHSTPATVYDNDIPLEYGIDVPFPLDPALLDTSIDGASNDARIDTASLVEAGECLTSCDTPALISCGSTPNVAFAAAGLPKRAMRSLSCPRAQIGSHEAAKSHRRLCKSMSPVHENSMPDVGSRSQDDVSRGLKNTVETRSWRVISRRHRHQSESGWKGSRKTKVV
ncbi:hypothetical protein QQS21_000127 [Conoideocrella luteorostrata]|uniref:Uncharacterized protein n=1 Tax=Conoideocrella luteorostrata TaxID=1105319 RepID=A0AAJ0G4B6_9HYPO|nr:hypothetical protein QQS21_000127 [Conoideocrella luteorostrata]